MRDSQLWFNVFQKLGVSDILKCKLLNKTFKKYANDYCQKKFGVFNKWKKTQSDLVSGNYDVSDSIVTPNVFLQDCGLFVDLILTKNEFVLEIWSAFEIKRKICGNLPHDFATGKDHCFSHAQPHFNKAENLLVWHYQFFDFVLSLSDISKIAYEWKNERKKCDLYPGLGFCPLCCQLFAGKRGRMFNVYDSFHCEYAFRDVKVMDDSTRRILTLTSVGKGGYPSLEVSVNGVRKSLSGGYFYQIFPFGYNQRYYLCLGLNDNSCIVDLVQLICHQIKLPKNVQFVAFDDIKESLKIVCADEIIVLNKFKKSQNSKSKWVYDHTTSIKDTPMNAFFKFCPFTQEFVYTFSLNPNSLNVQQWFSYIRPFLLKKNDILSLERGQTLELIQINKSDVYENFNCYPYKTLTPIQSLTYERVLYTHQEGLRGILKQQQFVFRRHSKTPEGWDTWIKIKKNYNLSDDTPIGKKAFMMTEENFIKSIPQTLVEQRYFIVY